MTTTPLDQTSFVVNGTPESVRSDHPHLLAALREELDITSPKDGCAPSGHCGACTVLLDGKAIQSCLVDMEKAAGKEVTTLEGLPEDERAQLASFLGCSKDELAITHNATEAMSIIAGGMPLEPGAEVLLTDQEHPSGRGPWQVREAKGELTTREVVLPMPPESAEQLVDTVIAAIGPRTRVLSFSGIMSPTGLLMPIREICTAARERGVITVVDGAHMAGQVPHRLVT